MCVCMCVVYINARGAGGVMCLPSPEGVAKKERVRCTCGASLMSSDCLLASMISAMEVGRVEVKARLFVFSQELREWRCDHHLRY